MRPLHDVAAELGHAPAQVLICDDVTKVRAPGKIILVSSIKPTAAGGGRLGVAYAQCLATAASCISLQV